MEHVSQAMKKHQAEAALHAVAVPLMSPLPAGIPSRQGAPEQVIAPPRSSPILQPLRVFTPEAEGPRITNGYSPVLIAHHDCGHHIAEQYRSVRTHLLSFYENKPFTLMLASAQGGEGKTVTCLNLAFILGRQRGCRTVVVDADLRHGKVARLLRQPHPIGLADLLRRDATLDEIICPTVYPTVSVICAGKCSRGEAGELVSHPELAETLQELQKRNDFVLVDTPPIAPLSDTCTIGQVVGDALLVVRANHTQQEAVENAVKQLKELSVRTVGIVLTHQRDTRLSLAE